MVLQESIEICLLCDFHLFHVVYIQLFFSFWELGGVTCIWKINPDDFPLGKAKTFHCSNIFGLSIHSLSLVQDHRRVEPHPNWHRASGRVPYSNLQLPVNLILCEMVDSNRGPSCCKTQVLTNSFFKHGDKKEKTNGLLSTDYFKRLELISLNVLTCCHVWQVVWWNLACHCR